MTLAELIFAICFFGVLTYLLYHMLKQGSRAGGDIEKPEYKTAYKHLFIGGVIGFILGFVIAMSLNPPFKGMLDTAADVKGLVIASWFLGGGIGAILMAFTALMTSGLKRKKIVIISCAR